MKKRVERLRGMHDILPEAYQHRRWLTDSLSTFLAQAGYVTVDTPMLEHSDLFLTSFGQELWQNLYAFRLHHRDLCLRPEYTASICRLYLDHYQQQHLPLRFQYAGPIFRYEAPGRNRYRQHTQLGVELFGGQAVAADAEIVQLACDVLQKLHITQYRLELGHIGVASGFIQRLRLDEQAARLLLSLMEQISRSEEGERAAQARLEALYPLNTVEGSNGEIAAGGISEVETRFMTSLLNGISISFGDDTVRDEVVERFLWKVGRSEQRRQILHALEFMRALHALSGSPPLVFDELRALLASYELDAEPLAELEQLVAIVEDGFDAQLCGGGRYDHLVRAVGGNRDINACGFAFGIERLLSLLDRSDLPSYESTRALVIPVSQSDVPYALQVARSTRLQGLWTEVDVSGHGVGAGLKIATRKQIALAIIVGESEQRTQRVTLKDLQTGEERVLAVDTLAENIAHKEQWQ
ncbi:MAG: histidine--tRNA ligase family protein [Chloroflexi bacterium]|nr:MAG: histidine--tRNA ligase family protein [Chloroflexota bacterium]